MKKIRSFLIVVLLISSTGGSYSQAVFPSGGGSVSSATGSVSYTIGQTVLADGQGSTGLIGSGFQQPYEKVIVNGLNDDPSIDLDIVTYPNPVNDHLKLKTSGSESSDMFFRLFNSKGDLLINKKVDSDEMDISMKSYTPGTYIINVYRNDVSVRSIKIIKK
jgi:hypothetical protein